MLEEHWESTDFLIKTVKFDIFNTLLNKISEQLTGEILSKFELKQIAQVLAQNNPEQNRDKFFFVDISELVAHDSGSGIARVTRSILKELLSSAPKGFKVQAVYATRDQHGYREANQFVRTFSQDFSERKKDVAIEFQPGDIFFGLDLQTEIVRSQMLTLKKMHQSGVKIYFLVHDLLPVTHPDCFLDGAKLAHENWLKNISKFDGVVCVSQIVAENFSSWFEKNIGKCWRNFDIKWSHNAAFVNSRKTFMPENSLQSKMISQIQARVSFLMVSTIEPRKCYEQAFNAFQLLWDEGIEINLVIVGRKGWFVDFLTKKIVSHQEFNSKLFWLNRVDDQYLEGIYQASHCLIAASLDEGFGLPLIEAAQKKLPIIARDIPIFKEVAGKHAFYFKGEKADDLARGIKQWLELYKEKKHPRSDDMPWLTWRESTDNLIATLGLTRFSKNHNEEL